MRGGAVQASSQENGRLFPHQMTDFTGKFGISIEKGRVGVGGDLFSQQLKAALSSADAPASHR